MTAHFTNESLLNFSTPEARSSMEKALQTVKAQFGRSYGLKNGAVLAQKPSEYVTSVNPANPSEVTGYTVKASVADTEAALAAMYDGAKRWGKTPATKRIELLQALGTWMRRERYELAALMVYEVGKTWREADADVCEAIDFCFYYALEMERLSLEHVTQKIAGEHDVLVYHPRGVAVVIAPWNFPLAILAGMTVAALVTGNTVIFKPAEPSSIIAAKLAQGLTEVGFPEYSFYYLSGSGSQIGPILTNDARVDLIAFTGSAEVGLSIIQSAAQPPKQTQRGVKKVIAEMGGKNALIIDEDADLDEALVACVQSSFGFQGQKCSALSRLLVHASIYDAFVPRFVEATKALRIGNPWQPEYQVGPVVEERAYKRIRGIIDAAKTRLKTLYSSDEVPTTGYFIAPTIFEVTDRNDDIFQNEIFGPVVAVKKFSTFDEAIEDANSVRYALTGGIFSRSPSHIERAKQEFEVGNLYINRGITGAVVQRHPFGGFKMSGVGSKAGGPDYLLQFVEPRTIAENTVRRGFAGE